MKIVLTGPKCSGKSLIGKLLSQGFFLPFFETDELIEQLFAEEKKEKLSCRVICSEFGEDVFRNYERRVIKQVSKYDFCIVSTGGSALLNKESRELFRQNAVLVLLYASTAALFDRLSKKDIPSFLKDKDSRDLFAARANLVIEALKPFSDIAIDSSEMDKSETLSTLTSSLRNLLSLSPEKYLNNQNSSLLALGQLDSSKFLFSLNEKLFKNPLETKNIAYSSLDSITIKKEILSGYDDKSWISFFSAEINKQLVKKINDVYKNYFIGIKKKTDVLSPILAGMLARNILKNSGININAFFTSELSEKSNIRVLSISIKTGNLYKDKRTEFFSAISIFFLSCVDVKFDLNENKQQLSGEKDVISFSLASPLQEGQIIEEVINLYCSLIVFNIMH